MDINGDGEVSGVEILNAISGTSARHVVQVQQPEVIRRGTVADTQEAISQNRLKTQLTPD